MGPLGRFPSPSLSPVDSSLQGREPCVEVIVRFGCRVIRNPSAAEPLLTVSLSQREMSRSDRGILMGPAGRFPSPSLCPVGSSLLGREPHAESISRYLRRVIRGPTAAEPLPPNLDLDLLSAAAGSIFYFADSASSRRIHPAALPRLFSKGLHALG